MKCSKEQRWPADLSRKGVYHTDSHRFRLGIRAAQPEAGSAAAVPRDCCAHDPDPATGSWLPQCPPPPLEMECCSLTSTPRRGCAHPNFPASLALDSEPGVGASDPRLAAHSLKAKEAGKVPGSFQLPQSRILQTEKGFRNRAAKKIPQISVTDRFPL